MAKIVVLATGGTIAGSADDAADGETENEQNRVPAVRHVLHLPLRHSAA